MDATAYEPRDARDYAHTGPGTLAGRYLRLFWHPVLRSDALAPGQVMPLRVMGEDFTLFRGAGGTAQVLAQRCAHRGAQLSIGSVEGDCLRCMYHGWMYDAAGQCVDQPAERAGLAAKVRIRSYPTVEKLGLVFAYLGDGDAPPFPSLPGFDDFEGLILADSYTRRCNYFQSFENAVDIVHTGFVHRGGHEHVGDELPELSCHQSSAGVTISARLVSSGKTLINQLGMPNRFHMNFPAPPQIGWQGVLMFWVPVDDSAHLLFSVYRVPVTGDAVERFKAARAARSAGWDLSHSELADQILAGTLRMSDVDTSRTDLIRLQDDISQIGQGVIADRVNEKLGRSDVGVALLRRLWTRELNALAEGRELTTWESPTSLPVRFYEPMEEAELAGLMKVGS